MDSVDVDIPMSDGAHATATASLPSPRSVTGTKRGRDGAEDIDEWSPKFLQLPSVVIREDAVIAAAKDRWSRRRGHECGPPNSN